VSSQVAILILANLIPSQEFVAHLLFVAFTTTLIHPLRLLIRKDEPQRRGDVSGQRSTALEWTSAVELGS